MALTKHELSRQKVRIRYNLHNPTSLRDILKIREQHPDIELFVEAELEWEYGDEHSKLYIYGERDETDDEYAQRIVKLKEEYDRRAKENTELRKKRAEEEKKLYLRLKKKYDNFDFGRGDKLSN